MPGIHLDAVGGIAGDMFVAALLDACPDLRARALADAAAVLPAGMAADLHETSNGGLRALGFGLAGARHHRGVKHHHDQQHGHHHGSGTFPDMVQRIRGADLHAGTADQAIAILTLLAEVEAGIHQVRLEDVHFHELADWDSLLDVVAAGSIAAGLPTARWTVSALPRGGGLVKTAHGLLPVPAPATAALLTGFAWRDDGIGGERVTPTGAAILRHLVGPAGSGAAVTGRLAGVGTGAGTRTMPGMANVLRALVFEDAPTPARDLVATIAFEIDDMTGEEIAVAADRLRAVPGVLDLITITAQGKKGRPMQSFRLLVQTARVDDVAERCFAETSTIGLRFGEASRRILPRHQALVTAGDAAVGVKTVTRNGAPSRKAESDDLVADSLAARRRLKMQAETDDV